MVYLSQTVLLLAAFQLSSVAALLAPKPTCRVLPDDPGWPSISQWDAFNRTVEGRLVRTIPIGTPCHAAHFDAEACAFVQNNWNSADLHDVSSSSVMTPYLTNNSCNPFTGPDSQCIIGTYVQYAVNVSTPAHVVNTVKFAKQHNIRLVVRNTGHDFVGKSTGTGGLAVWTHHLKGTEWIHNYKSPAYTGPAVKAAAGMQVHELYEDADANGHVLVGGGCPTVGFAGGYLQGGGHSPLSSIHGMAADQTLSFEVITTTGSFVTASPIQNADLYWALSGGGGGTYGIVWSVTVKAYPPVPVASATLSFTTAPNVSFDTWWDAVDVYQASIPKYNAAGGYGLGGITNGSFGPFVFMFPTHDNSSNATQEILQPLIDHLKASTIPHNITFAAFPSFLSGYDASFPDSMFAVGTTQLGSGRLIPTAVWKHQNRYKEMSNIVKAIIKDGGSIVDVVTAPSFAVAGHPSPNAVLPAWRQTEREIVPILPWSDTASAETISKQRHTLTWTYGGPLRKLTPESGAYLNEADSADPDWKNSFYGVNYPKLLQIKDKWDPDQMLYGPTAVGGDRWAENGRGALCKV